MLGEPPVACDFWLSRNWLQEQAQAQASGRLVVHDACACASASAENGPSGLFCEVCHCLAGDLFQRGAAAGTGVETCDHLDETLWTSAGPHWSSYWNRHDSQLQVFPVEMCGADHSAAARVQHPAGQALLLAQVCLVWTTLHAVRVRCLLLVLESFHLL